MPFSHGYPHKGRSAGDMEHEGASHTTVLRMTQIQPFGWETRQAKRFEMLTVQKARCFKQRFSIWVGVVCFPTSHLSGDADSLLLVTRALTSVNRRKEADKLARDRSPGCNISASG